MDEQEKQDTAGKDELISLRTTQSQLALCQRLAMLGRLSVIVAHEVNNQLTGVSGYTQLLMGAERAAGLEKELDKIQASADRCQSLINQMRRAGRYGDGEYEFGNINLIINSALDLLRHQFKKRSLEIIENFSDEIQATRLDTPALEQVFLNIVQNSLEALVEKGGSLTVSTSSDGETVVATFIDDGPGLSEEALENLFVPFFTTKAQLNCPGLGLAAAKIIVEQHGGSIEVGNSPAGGASVRIALPAMSDMD